MANCTNAAADIAQRTSRKETVEAWIESFATKRTPSNTKRDVYEVKHTGPDNIRVADGGEHIWTDGIRAEDGCLLEAKFIESPNRSPFVDDSNIPEFIRQKIIAEVEDEFRRYAAVIHDLNTPLECLEVIVNDTRAVPFFDRLLAKYRIPGCVVTKD